jgi:hypothetical protein
MEPCIRSSRGENRFALFIRLQMPTLSTGKRTLASIDLTFSMTTTLIAYSWRFQRVITGVLVRLVKWLSSSHPGFVPTPSSIDMARYDSASLCQAMRRGGFAVLRFVGHVFQAVWVIIFGRGSAPNANIQLRSLMSVSEDMESGDYDAADDEEWNGLPEERVVSQQLV